MDCEAMSTHTGERTASAVPAGQTTVRLKEDTPQGEEKHLAWGIRKRGFSEAAFIATLPTTLTCSVNEAEYSTGQNRHMKGITYKRQTILSGLQGTAHLS